MRKILLLSLILASPLAIAGPQCTTAERSQWQDEKAFQDKRKVEIYHDPVTGKAVKTEIKG